MKEHEIKCRACGYSWQPRKPNPVECPECKARLNRQQKKQEIGNG